MAFEVHTVLGELVVDAVSLHTPAWKIHDVVHFWFDSPLAGDIEPIPGSDGGLDAPMRHTSALISQDFSMCGDVNHLGEPYEAVGDYKARAVGLASNMNFLRAEVLTGRPLTGARTRAAQLFVPGEALPRVADVQVWLEPGSVNNQWVFQTTMWFRIAAGIFL